MLTEYINQKVRIILYKNNQVEVDLICKNLDNEIADLFRQYKFIGHHITKITGLNVITLVKE